MGDELYPPYDCTPEEIEMILGKINKTDSCWLWTHRNDRKGYGIINFRYREMRIHRLMYQHFVGPLIKGLIICHKCDVPPCCNPDHLFQGTPKDNTQDMIKKGRYRNGYENYKHRYLWGVVKHRNKWLARASINGKIRYMGSFETPEEAHERSKEVRERILAESQQKPTQEVS